MLYDTVSRTDVVMNLSNLSDVYVVAGCLEFVEAGSTSHQNQCYGAK